MKRIFTLWMLFSLFTLTSAQWVVEPYDTAGNDGYWLYQFYSNGTATAKMELSNNNSDFVQGTGSLQCEYRIEAKDSWGGYGVRVFRTDSAFAEKRYMDLSAGTSLNVNYKIVDPAVMSAPGSVFIEWKLTEENGDAGTDLFYYQTPANLTTANGWVTLSMPLKQTEDKTLGFALQTSNGGDAVLQLDKIVGFEVAIVYITQGNAANPPSAVGTILFDNMQLIGSSYPVIETFDAVATDDSFIVDYMSWAGEGAGSLNLTNNSTDLIEGSSSLQLDYTVNSSQDWGGFVSIDHDLGDTIANFGERTSLYLYIKNTLPNTSVNPERLKMHLFLKENSSGVNEDWVISIPIELNKSSEWERYALPLVQKAILKDTLNGKEVTYYPSNGFAQPGAGTQGDGRFNQDFVHAYRLELISLGNDYGYTVGEKFTGTLLVDLLQQGGYKSTDLTPPVAPKDVVALINTYTNIVAWSDVPNEENEEYNVYFSTSPIASLDAPGVDVAELGVNEGTQNLTHVLIAPVVDQPVSYYYAVNAVDNVGNVGVHASTGPVTNTAKGVTTIHPEAPVSFKADGKLGEWSGITSFRMFPSDGSGTIVSNSLIDGDEDLSVEMWVAMDNENVYFAFDVNDDIVSSDTVLASYLRDCPDVHLGLYDWRTATHTSYEGGEEPDYQFRFNSNQAIIANLGDYVVARPGDENYFWGEKFTGGYTVECKLSFAEIAAVRSGDVVFTPMIGKRIRIDSGINDADATGEREGVMTYSPRNQDQSWSDPSRWTYTWIGDKWTAIEDEKITPNKFELAQNYPNPFNPTTVINYSIDKPGFVQLSVFNILGQKVAHLVNEYKQSGSYNVQFNANNLSSGVYFYELNAGNMSSVKKMLLLR